MNQRFFRDQQYVVLDAKVQIVDEYTGRVQPGRTWNDGLHQAIEARERVPLTAETGHLARVTMPDFVRRFPLVAGMTGTAREAASEFRRLYDLRVKSIPTHRPNRRRTLATALYPTSDDKLTAIVAEVRQVLRRAVHAGGHALHRGFS
ncbi:MAG: hypothetical protein R3B90_22260 [Planctomycetaceae bacterium]